MDQFGDKGGRSAVKPSGKGGGKNGDSNGKGHSKGSDPAPAKQDSGKGKGARGPVQAAEPAQPTRPRHGAGSSRTTSTTLAHLTDGSFTQLKLLPVLQRAITEVFEYEKMTKVQQQAIPVCIAGSDVVAKAKTGTGKTLGFLLPALHTVLSAKPRAGSVQILVLSPTRELAMQTAQEAQALLTYSELKEVQTALGGTNVRGEVNAFNRKPPLVLVATPGRLIDHFENHGFLKYMDSLKVLIFDEADQLLDMGFRPAIEQILGLLPSRDFRQTLLFSATFPASVTSISKIALRPGHQMIDTIGAHEEATVQQVTQKVAVCGMDDLLPLTHAVLARHAKMPGHKVIIFLPTARQAQLFATLFSQIKMKGTRVWEIHSRKSQAHRTRVADEFRMAESGMLFSSDVSARGMDYPDVTFVFQVGVPADRAQYLHRLGRTARAGKEGAGLLLLCDFEEYFLRDLKDLPLKKENVATPAEKQFSTDTVWQALPQIHRADPKLGSMAYQAWLGFYNSQRRIAWDKPELVQQANYFATEVIGCHEVPPIQKKTVGKMGLKGVPGLNLCN